MRLDKEAFNAEVRRRGKERIIARKRVRKRMLVSCASLAACLLLIAILPNFELWKPSDFAADMSPQDQDSMSGANADQITENDQTGQITGQEAPDADQNPPQDAPPSAADPNLPEAPGSALGSVMVTAEKDDEFELLHIDRALLTELDSLFESICQSDHEALPGETPDYEGATGYRITATYEDGAQAEYVWSGVSWHIAKENRTILLTADEREALTILLLENQAD